MLERFFKSQVATVSDSTYCHRITDALTAAGIKCYCKTKDVNQRSVFDATRMRAQIGTFGIKPQYITEIRSVYKGLHADHETGAADNK